MLKKKELMLEIFKVNKILEERTKNHNEGWRLEIMRALEKEKTWL